MSGSDRETLILTGANSPNRTNYSEVIEQLGQAVAKVHCVSDTDSDQSLVDFRTEVAIVAVIGDHEDEFITDIVEFAVP